MKKYRFLALLLVLLSLVTMFAGCKKEETPEVPVIEEPVPEPEPIPEPEPEPEPEPVFTNPLTGVETTEEIQKRRPYAIMMNNLSGALPQHGISKADIIYEVLAESGITRMLALFQDVTDIGPIGSIRSARHYYVELAQGHDALYIHAGGSPQAYTMLYSNVVDYVDGVNGRYGTAAFYRDSGRRNSGYAYEHTLFTSSDRLAEHVDTLTIYPHEHAEGYVYPQTFKEDATPAGEEAAMIRAIFRGGKKTSFEYDAESKLYKVYEYGSAYVDGNTGDQVSITNVLILFTDVHNIAGDNKGRINVRTTGEGEGWFACGGKYIPIKWSRENADKPFSYTLEDGTPLDLGIGRSYVCVMPNSGSEVTFTME